MDRGANGGIIGNDARVHHVHLRKIDVTGIDNHEQFAQVGRRCSQDHDQQRSCYWDIPTVRLRCRTIHSSGQFEAYKNHVDDRSMKFGGTQCIRTNEGYVIPLDIINGLPYLKMQPHTDTEWNELCDSYWR
jgi:hypothetical protein